MAKTKKTIQRKTASKHKQRSNSQHPKHFLKVYWPYIPVILVVVFGMFFGGVHPNQRQQSPATLAYSTEMGVAALLEHTNAQRANNGLGPLGLNAKLNNSAQAKANDMISKDYWSHNSPNGDAPWVFFDAAGYSYQKAGENLAYGFSTSNATVIGWMNSPSHRANILDQTYNEVGFGFANSENFVGTGPETVVVAHYGQSLGAATPPPPPPPAPAPTQPKPKTLQAQNETEPVEEAAPPPAPEIPVEEVKSPLPADRINQPINSDNPIPSDPESTNITRIQRLTGGNAPWSALAVSLGAFIIVFVWLIKHAVLVKRFVMQGEHFVAHHPLLDLFVVIIAAIAVYLSQSTGVVL